MINIEHLKDLAELARGIVILTGVNTEELYVPVVDLPVQRDGSLVGVFTFDEDTETFVFKEKE